MLLWIVLDNAVKYTPAPGRIRVTLAGGGENITVTVEDNGIGISATDQEPGGGIRPGPVHCQMDRERSSRESMGREPGGLRIFVPDGVSLVRLRPASAEGLFGRGIHDRGGILIGEAGHQRLEGSNGGGSKGGRAFARWPGRLFTSVAQWQDIDGGADTTYLTLNL